ncbi:MAG: dehydrogenase [Verrucomicrobiales bacterium]|nr:dehydrogenase [Verrucomicrobiales bacterium]
MKSGLTLLIVALITASVFLGSDANAIDASGIKTANLKDADLDLINNHDPQSELENFDLLDGYQVNLFASDPMLANPVHMHWDASGRLWVACSWAYPQLKPGEVANDKIIILEDTDGDGAADKSTVFADGLYLPTGIEFANGGVYVGQSPDVFFLKDTDGDDIADVKELALTGFGIEDNHHSISAWRRGPGGWIYFQEGIFLHAQVETPFGVVRNYNGGVYQFNPRTQELRVFVRGTGGNPWGHVFEEWGQSFMVNNPRIMYLSPASGNSGKSVPVKPLISTEKQCGGDLATGTHIGDDIRGNLLSGRFKSRAIIRYEFVENGAGYSANVLEPLMTSKHPNFRPVDVKMGPDGGVYVADWYNSIINHAQHDFRDPRRDHDHGRIWRITHRERPLTRPTPVEGVPLEKLVTHLASSEPFVRQQVKKELEKRDWDEAHAAIEAWVDKLDASTENYDLNLVEAMWACQNVERVSEKILSKVINAKSGHARSAGARILRYWHSELSDPAMFIAETAGDEFPRARMEAVLSAGFVPSAEAYAAALHVLDYPGDPVLDQALPQTKAALERYWRPAMESGTLAFAKESHKEFAEASAGIGFTDRLDQFIAHASPSAMNGNAIKAQMPVVGLERDVRRSIDALIGKKGDISTDKKIVLLGALKASATKLNEPSAKRAVRHIHRLLSDDSDEVVTHAIETLAAWEVSSEAKELTVLLKDGSRRQTLRQAAALALASFDETEHLETLNALALEADIVTRYLALTGLLVKDLDAGIEVARTIFTEEPGDGDPVASIQSLLKQRKGVTFLVAALEGVEIHPDVKTRVTEFHRTSGQLPEAMVKLFQQTSNSGSLSAELLREDINQLTADADKLGDPYRGEMIYRRKAMACVGCHAIGSVGSYIGPNLVAVGGAASTSYMIESILSPNAAIAEHYENRLFTLDDGSVQMGVITFRSEEEIIVSDSAQGGKEISIPVAKILKEQGMPSLMPSGLADQLQSRSEFLDLVKFLSVLGKPGDFASDESPVLRKWRILADGKGTHIPGDNEPWVPAYSKVDGELPAEDLNIPGAKRIFARAWIDVQVPGKVGLMLNESEGVILYLNGERAESPVADIVLEKGRQEITFSIDRRKLKGGFRAELKAADEEVRFAAEGGI